MEKRDLLTLLLKGEDSFTEFKDEKVHPDDLAAEMVAFSNTEGGTLVIGVSDKGEILGLKDWDKTMQRLDNVASQNCEPPVYFIVEKVMIEDKHVASFAGEQIDEEFEKKDLEGKLEEQIQGVGTLFKLYLKTRVKIKGFANERRFEIPFEALREAVINAVAHRNYHLPAQVRIFIFADRIEIISPGKLPNTITLENIRLGVHTERNPLPVSFLSKMGYMTQIGTGVIRMIRLLKQYTGKEPEFEERGEEFLVRIWRPND